MNTTPITLEYFYSGEDLIGFSIQEGDAAAVNYYYGKTNNGEIRFIYDANGNIVTTYLYDAWGNPIPTDESSDSEVGEINPFRYKSYYYDSETRLYYLQSRYYDPQVGRFLNADSTDFLGATGTLLSYNLFAYCENNPVVYSDMLGLFIIKAWVVAAVLDSIFLLLNAAMMSGYIGYSATISMLSKSLITLKAAKVLFGTVVKVFIYGVYNTIMHVIRTALYRIAGVIFNFVSAKVIDSALNYFTGNLSALISMILTWGGLIAGVLDWLTDKKLDGNIVI